MSFSFYDSWLERPCVAAGRVFCEQVVEEPVEYMPVSAVGVFTVGPVGFAEGVHDVADVEDAHSSSSTGFEMMSSSATASFDDVYATNSSRVTSTSVPLNVSSGSVKYTCAMRTPTWTDS